mmetsp:Transcript_2621/g.4960  ORF Transcript_2621/g.4960 Transcript_2621/m.4960 type:complete len:1284 (-) Transcript_2621:84-3935(-)
MSYFCSYLPSSVLSYTKEQETEGKTVAPPLIHSYETAVLFADVSGYTAMCEKMASLGELGEEYLAKNLNAYFELLIKALMAQGGDVFKYAGDALLVMWPPSEEDLSTLVRRAAQAALNIQQSFQDAMVDMSLNVRLSVKIGIGAGPITILHLGGVYGRLEYIAIGEPLQQAFNAEHHATQREVIVSPTAWQLIQPYFIAVVTEDGYANVSSVLPQERLRNVNIAKYNAELKTLSEGVIRRIQAYIPTAIVPFAGQGDDKWISELRIISVLFVNLGVGEEELVRLSTPGPIKRIHAVLRDVQNAVYKYEGSLNKFLMDDKGSTLIAVFGLPPLAHEDDAVRAVVAGKAIQEALHQHDLRPSIGITTGRAFCGVVGNRGRREYSVLGDTVNLSARLMQRATECGAGVLCDRATRNAARRQRSAWCSVAFDEVDEIQVKGKLVPVRMYQPIVKDRPADFMEQHLEECLQRERESSGGLVSSDPELRDNRALLVDKLTHSQGGEAVLIEAEPGFGKSKLLLATLLETPHAETFVQFVEGSPFDSNCAMLVWKQVLERLLFHAKIRKNPRRWIREVLAAAGGAEMEVWAPAFNCVLTGPQYEDTEETEDFSPEQKVTKAMELFPAVLQAILKELGRKRLAIVVDGAHNMDALSWQFCSCVAATENVVLVMATRPLNKVYMNKFAKQVPPLGLGVLTKMPATTVIRLGVRDANVIQRIAARSLKSPIKKFIFPKSLVHLVVGKAKGSPSIACSLVRHFQELDLVTVEESGKVHVSNDLCASKKDVAEEEKTMAKRRNPKSTVVRMPGDLMAVHAATLDRFTLGQQQILKVAAVQGQTFSWQLTKQCYCLDTETLTRPLDAELQELLSLNVIHKTDQPDIFAFAVALLRDIILSRLLMAHQTAVIKKIRTLDKALFPEPEEGSQHKQVVAVKRFQDSLMEGTLKKCGGRIKTWNSRYFVLFSDKLIYFKDEHTTDKAAKGEIPIAVDTCFNLALNRDSCTFTITPPTQTGHHVNYEMRADSEADAISWSQAIERLLKAKKRDREASRGLQGFRLSEIQAALQTVEISSPKMISESVQEGFLMKRGNNIKTWKKRYFVLLNDKLNYYTTNSIKTIKGSIQLHGNAAVELVPDLPCTLSVCTEMGGRRYIMTAKDDEEVNSWKEVLEAVITRARPLEHSEAKIAFHSVLEGKLRKKGGTLGNWANRYFVLFSNKLQYFDESKKEVKGELKLYRETSLEPDPKDPCKFLIKPELGNTKGYLLWAQSKEEAETWIAKIKDQLAIAPSADPNAPS